MNRGKDTVKKVFLEDIFIFTNQKFFN